MDTATFLTAFTALFVIVDPIGAAIIFHSLVPSNDPHHSRHMAIKASIISTILLLVFGLYGAPFLAYLGIDIDSLRVAGGLLLFYTAFGMITQGAEYTSTATKTDISVYPLSIPLLAGPGSLTLVILLFAKAPTFASDMAVVAAITSVLFLTLLLMLIAPALKRVIGHTGDEILRRFLGVILAALAVQFVHDGIVNLGAVS